MEDRFLEEVVGCIFLMFLGIITEGDNSMSLVMLPCFSLFLPFGLSAAVKLSQNPVLRYANGVLPLMPACLHHDLTVKSEFLAWGLIASIISWACTTLNFTFSFNSCCQIVTISSIHWGRAQCDTPTPICLCPFFPTSHWLLQYAPSKNVPVGHILSQQVVIVKYFCTSFSLIIVICHTSAKCDLDYANKTSVVHISVLTYFQYKCFTSALFWDKFIPPK